MGVRKCTSWCIFCHVHLVVHTNGAFFAGTTTPTVALKNWAYFPLHSTKSSLLRNKCFFLYACRLINGGLLDPALLMRY